MIIRHLITAVLIALAAATTWALTQWLDTWLGLAAWTVGIGLATTGAALLVRTAEIGKISWKNRVAGYLLRWGYVLGKGKLERITAISFTLWFFIGLAVVVISVGPTRSDGVIAAGSSSPASAPAFTYADDRGSPFVHHPVVATLLLASWIVDGGLIFYIAGLLSRQYSPGSRNVISLSKILAVLIAMVVVGAALFFSGHPLPALLVSGGPVAALSLVYGLFVAAMLIFGRNARWN